MVQSILNNENFPLQKTETDCIALQLQTEDEIENETEKYKKRQTGFEFNEVDLTTTNKSFGKKLTIF